jgi:hypothetical protein
MVDFTAVIVVKWNIQFFNPHPMLLLILIVFVVSLGFGNNEKPSKLPPFTKEEAGDYWKNFDKFN